MELTWREISESGATVLRAQEWADEQSPKMKGVAYAVHENAGQFDCFVALDGKSGFLGQFQSSDDGKSVCQADFDARSES